MKKQRFIAKGYLYNETAIRSGLATFISSVPANGVGIITVPRINQLKYSDLANLLVAVGLGALTKGGRTLGLDNGGQLYLAPIGADTLRQADTILSIWPLASDLTALEAWNRWLTLAVVSYQDSDTNEWEAKYSPQPL